MAVLRLPNRAALADEDCCVYQTAPDSPRYVREVFYDAMLADLRLLHEHDMAWAKRVAAEHGIDLEALADADPTYRAEFRR